MSTRIRYGLFARVLLRCYEVAKEADAKKTVTMVFRDRLKDPADLFLAAHDAVTKEEGGWAKENNEALAALGVLDQPYQETLAVLAAYLPHEVLPTTLKTLSTDTDRLKAIGDLLNLLDLNQANEWAVDLLSGTFGTQAPKTVTELEESIEAIKAYSEARDDRAGAYGLAYERYLAFKKVVRAAEGPKSKQYQRIHIRSGRTSEPTPQPTPPTS